jgi:hypothetical protein
MRQSNDLRIAPFLPALDTSRQSLRRYERRINRMYVRAHGTREKPMPADFRKAGRRLEN